MKVILTTTATMTIQSVAKDNYQAAKQLEALLNKIAQDIHNRYTNSFFSGYLSPEEQLFFEFVNENAN